jgi:hypothetical protein
LGAEAVKPDNDNADGSDHHDGNPAGKCNRHFGSLGSG